MFTDNDVYEDFTKTNLVLANIKKIQNFMKLFLFHDKANKKVISKIKDETKGVPTVEFVGLKSKMFHSKR